MGRGHLSSQVPAPAWVSREPLLPPAEGKLWWAGAHSHGDRGNPCSSGLSLHLCHRQSPRRYIFLVDFFQVSLPENQKFAAVYLNIPNNSTIWGNKCLLDKKKNTQHNYDFPQIYFLLGLGHGRAVAHRPGHTSEGSEGSEVCERLWGSWTASQ